MDQSNNWQVYNDYVHEYAQYDLYPSELHIINHFKSLWHESSLLDIGIGTGRTTKIFSTLVKRYTGIDYAEMMVERTRKVVHPYEHVQLHHQNACDLSRFYDLQYDFVLFSLNGIDSVSHDQREQILSEVRKVLAPSGHFIFSTHSIRGFKPFRKLPSMNVKKPVRSLYHRARALRFNKRLQSHYPQRTLRELKEQDWAVMMTGDHDFKMPIYHVCPNYQMKRLEYLGFKVTMVFDLHGGQVDPEDTMANTLYFVCQLADEQNTETTNPEDGA